MTVDLDWTEAVSNVSQVETYELYRSDGVLDTDPDFLSSFTRIATLEVERDDFGEITNDPTSYEDTEADLEDDFYHYYVLAVPVRVGEANTPSEPPTRSNIVAASVPPAAPILSDNGSVIDSIELAWAASNSLVLEITGYQIWRSTSGGDFELIDTVDDTVLTYSDSDVDRINESYQYKVAAVNEIGVTQDSNTVSFSQGVLQTETFTVDGSWSTPSSVASIRYALLVGGGGSGGSSGGGGGGGGGGVLFAENVSVTPGQIYNYVVGTGRASTVSGGRGEDTTIFGLTAFGGGDGAQPDTTHDGADGGSGGGGGGDFNSSGHSGGATLDASQGNAGGDGPVTDGANACGGGGGGAGEAGQQGVMNQYGGYGGDGVDMSSIFGTSVGQEGWFGGGGGGGGGFVGVGGDGGMGGGKGGEGTSNGDQLANSFANSGGGGGGFNSGNGPRGTGHNGIIIIKYYTFP